MSIKSINEEKILIINLWPGGSNHYTTQLANILSEIGTLQILLSKNCDLNLLNENIGVHKFNKAIPIQYTKILEYLELLNPVNYFKILLQIQKIQPDKIIIGFFHPFLFFVCLIYRNVFFIYHDPQGHQGEKNIILHCFQTICAFLSKGIFVHSKSLVSKNNKYIQNKTHIIPHQDYSFFKNFGNETIKPKNEILFIGRFIKYKGVEYLIRAFTEIQNDFPEWKLVIKGYGNPYFSEELKKINNKQLIYKNQYISDEEFADSIRQAKLVVLPYIDGSQSGVIAVAASFKKLVITTGVAGIKDQGISDKSAIIIIPKDNNSIATAIKTAILGGKKLQDELGENLFQYYQEYGNCEIIRNKIINTIN